MNEKDAQQSKEKCSRMVFSSGNRILNVNLARAALNISGQAWLGSYVNPRSKSTRCHESPNPRGYKGSGPA